MTPSLSLQLFFRFLFTLFLLSSSSRIGLKVEQLYGNLVEYYKGISNGDQNVMACSPGSGNLSCLSLNRADSLLFDPAKVNKEDLIIRKQLHNISPFFVFNDSKLNYQMHTVLSTFLPDVDSLTNPRIHDIFELAQFKVLSRSYFYKNIPYFISIAMLYTHEILYGSLLPYADYMHQFKNFLTEKVVDMNFNLQSTLDFYFKYIRTKFPSNWSEEKKDHTILQVSKLIEFVKSKPDQIDLKNFSSDFYKEYQDTLLVAPEIYAMLTRNMHHLFISDNNLAKFFGYHLFSQTFSQSFIDRFPDNSTELRKYLGDEFVIYYSSYKQTRTMRALYKKVDVPEGNLFKQFYAYNYDSEPFDLTNFLNFKGNFDDLLNEIATLPNPSILQLFIGYQIILSKKIDFEVVPQESRALMTNIFHNSLDCKIFSLILENCKSSVNMFFSFNDGKSYMHAFQRPMSYFSDYGAKMKFFLHSLKSNNPLPLIFIHMDFLKLVKHIIFENFNLRHRYVVDGDFSNLVMDKSSSHISTPFKGLEGEILSFYNIIQALQVNGLAEIFTSKNLKDIEPDMSSKPISLSNYLHYGNITSINGDD